MKQEIQRSYDRFCTFMEKNTLGAELCSYGVALTGLTIALRRVRPFSKFKRPSDIPNRFIREKKELIGTVQRIEPNGALLMLEHKPPYTLPFTRAGSLPVKIAGIDVSGLGISWLQTLVAGKEVTCIPLKKCKNYVECTVTLQQKTLDDKLRLMNVGESLVAVDFASLVKSTEKKAEPAIEDPFLAKYFGILQSAERRALKKRLGLKYYINSAKSILVNVFNRLNASLQSQVQKKTKSPKVAVS